MSNRFDYIRYDSQSIEKQALFKDLFQQIESAVEDQLSSPRARALVLTHLEEAYCWVGKAIRDDQIAYTGTDELQEERSYE